MKTLKALLLVAVVLSADYFVTADPIPEEYDHGPLAPAALHQFRNIMLCTMPHSWPIMDYADYGCYCGRGGSGTPVDDTDRCCQVHDNCYGEVQKHPKCSGLWGYNFLNSIIPYVRWYDYTCVNNKVTCLASNTECKMFLCDCDRKAGECFAKSKWIPAHEHWTRRNKC